MQQKTAIVIGDSFNNTLGLIRSLGQAKVKVILMLVGKDRLFVCRSRYVSTSIKVNSLDECDSILDEWKNQYRGSTIICTNDKAAKWVDEREKFLSKYFLTPMRGKTLGGLFEKPEQCKLANKFGITVPQSFVYWRGEEIPANLRLPLLMKPANSNKGSKSDIHICQNIEQMRDALARPSDCESFICQEYIDKEFEINMIGVATDQGVFIPGGIKKLRHYPNIFSPCSFGRFLSAEALNIDTAPIKAMINDIGYRGPLSIEFLRSKGKSYFMEVNFRNDGLAYAATAAGVNLMEIYFSDASIESKVKPTYMMDLSTDYCHVKDGQLTKLRWLKDFIRTGCQLNFNWRDPMPTIYYYRSKLGMI